MKSPKPKQPTKANITKALKAAGFYKSTFERSGRIRGWGRWTEGFSIDEVGTPYKNADAFEFSLDYNCADRKIGDAAGRAELRAAQIEAMETSLRETFDVVFLEVVRVNGATVKDVFRSVIREKGSLC
jgi:hypothetical protein